MVLTHIGWTMNIFCWNCGEWQRRRKFNGATSDPLHKWSPAMHLWSMNKWFLSPVIPVTSDPWHTWPPNHDVSPSGWIPWLLSQYKITVCTGRYRYIPGTCIKTKKCVHQGTAGRKRHGDNYIFPGSCGIFIEVNLGYHSWVVTGITCAFSKGDH